MSGSNRDNATAARAKADDNCDNDISYILSYPPLPPPLPEGEREGGREGGRETERQRESVCARERDGGSSSSPMYIQWRHTRKNP